MKQAILFDLDWTLLILDVDWNRLLKRIRKFFKKYGTGLEIKGIIRTSFLLSNELEKIGYNRRTILKKAYSIIKEEEIIGAKKARIIDNSKNLIEKLKDNFYLGIVTNNSMEAVSIALRKIGVNKRYFKTIVSRKIYLEPKPSPWPTLEALKRIPSKCERIYFVGDEPADIISAKNAEKISKRRIVTIAIQGWLKRKDLIKTKPDYILDSLDEIVKILQQ